MPSPSVQELRLLLRKKFPQAHGTPLDEPAETPPPPAGGMEAENPETPAWLRFSQPDAFPAGAISEIVPEGSAPVLGLLVAEILGAPDGPAGLPDLVLIDGNSFDPDSFPAAACSRLLWVRCDDALTLMKAADLMIRDGNIPFVMLDVCRFLPRELRALPASCWWRLKQLAERNGSRVLVLSPTRLVPCATLRLSLSSTFTLTDFDLPREELVQRIRSTPGRMRRTAN